MEYTNTIDNTQVFFICNNKIIYKNTTILEILDILDKQELEKQELEPQELDKQLAKLSFGKHLLSKVKSVNDIIIYLKKL